MTGMAEAVATFEVELELLLAFRAWDTDDCGLFSERQTCTQHKSISTV